MLRWLVVVLVLLAGGPARAADAFQESYERGVNLFLSERYADALGAFEAAYRARQLPRLLLNIGNAHRRLGHAKEAIDAYEAFLRAEPDAEPELRRKVDDYLVQARALLPAPAATAAKPVVRKPPVKVTVTATEKYPLVDVGTRANLRAITGGGPDDIWIAGDKATLLHFDGKAWSPTYRPWGGELVHLWGSAPDDVWAVGDGGLVLHFDGAAWHRAPSPLAADLVAVWGTRRGEAFTVDASGGLHRFEGTDWTPLGVDAPDDVNLRAAFHETTSNTVWAVGERGAVVRWDGRTLARLVSGTDEGLHGVWASGPRDVWLVGGAGTIVHFDGHNFAPAKSGSDGVLNDVWGSGPSDVWAVGLAAGGAGGGTILHFDGKAWSTAVARTPSVLLGVRGVAANEVYAVGAEGQVYRWDGSVWAQESARTWAALSAVWGRPGDVWVAGHDGAILRFDGRGWSNAHARGRYDFTGVWRAPDGSDVWAAGLGGVTLRYREGEWRVVPSGTTASFRALWGSGPRDVWAVGRNGTIRRFDGIGWRPVPSGVEVDLQAVWGTGPSDVWVAGERATLLHFDGRRFAPADSSFKGDYNHPTLQALWGSGPSDVWAAGTRWNKSSSDAKPPWGPLVHFDGNAWTTVTSFPTDYAQWGLAGTGSKEVWSVGGGLYRFDGKKWVAHEAGRDRSLSAAWATAAGDVWAVGDGGTVVHIGGR